MPLQKVTNFGRWGFLEKCIDFLKRLSQKELIFHLFFQELIQEWPEFMTPTFVIVFIFFIFFLSEKNAFWRMLRTQVLLTFFLNFAEKSKAILFRVIFGFNFTWKIFFHFSRKSGNYKNIFFELAMIVYSHVFKIHTVCNIRNLKETDTENFGTENIIIL